MKNEVNAKKNISKLETFEVARFEDSDKIQGGGSVECGGGNTQVPTYPNQ